MRTASNRRPVTQAFGFAPETVGDGFSDGAPMGSPPKVGPVRLSPVFDSERAAEALSDLLREAREVLDEIERAYDKGQAARPRARNRRDILRALLDVGAGLDVHDFPATGRIGASSARSMGLELAKEGLVSADRDEVYPNLVTFRITARGKEELRRLEVEEAMVWLSGTHGRLAEKTGRARSALERFVGAVSE